MNIFTLQHFNLIQPFSTFINEIVSDHEFKGKKAIYIKAIYLYERFHNILKNRGLQSLGKKDKKKNEKVLTFMFKGYIIHGFLNVTLL